MIVCDRCLDKKYSTINVNFEKTFEGKEPRRMLAVEMCLCEKCISELLKNFGKFKNQFLNQDEKTM